MIILAHRAASSNLEHAFSKGQIVPFISLDSIPLLSHLIQSGFHCCGSSMSNWYLQPPNTMHLTRDLLYLATFYWMIGSSSLSWIYLSAVNRPFFVPNCGRSCTHWPIVNFGSRFAHFRMYYSMRPNAYNMHKRFTIFSIPTRSTYHDAAATIFGHWSTIPMPQSFVWQGF